MFWVVLSLVIVIFVLTRFNMALNNDRKDLQSINVEEKFQVIANILNEHVFQNNADITEINPKSFLLSEEEKNQIIIFSYSTGNLTITWKYKYFQKELIHQKQYPGARNLSIFEQQQIANDIIKEMNIKIAKHKIDVMGVLQDNDVISSAYSTPKENEPKLRQNQNLASLNTDSKVKGSNTMHEGETYESTNEYENENYWVALGLEKFKENKFEDAIECFSAAILINFNKTEAYILRGDSKGKLGLHEEAIIDFDKALDINPEHTRAFNNRGFAKQMLGKDSSAIKDFDKAIELYPFNAVALANRGSSKVSLGDISSALDDFNKAISIEPIKGEFYNNRGLALYNQTRLTEAIEDFTKAIQLDPNVSDSFANRGFAKGSCGFWDGALVDFNKAIELAPKDSTLFMNRGQVKLALNDITGARYDLETAHRMGNKQAYELLQNL